MREMFALSFGASYMNLSMRDWALLRLWIYFKVSTEPS